LSPTEAGELVAARAGDRKAFDRLVAPHRAALHAHCYRMLGSLEDAADAVQDGLLGAWQGLAGFEGRSAFRSWLYTVATHAALRIAERRPRRVVSVELGPPADPTIPVVGPPLEAPWLEPYPAPAFESGVGSASPEARYTLSESVGLAFVAALQHLSPNQRAVLLVRDVLGFTAEETAAAFDTSVASVESTLARARQSLKSRFSATGADAPRRPLDDPSLQAFVERFVFAWQRSDVDAIVGMLAKDAVFTMPPLPQWFEGVAAIRAFLAEQVFQRRWRFLLASSNGQPALACYMWNDERQAFPLSALNVLEVRGDRVTAITAFLGEAVLARTGLPATQPRASGRSSDDRPVR
jgi:RNA polymerase sigma-70 factor (ECF subfamily)